MMKYKMKQKMAAMLCVAMLFGQAAPAMPVLHSTAYAEEETAEKVFGGASATGHNATYDTSSDGSISGSASFSGAKVVAKLYKDGSKVDETSIKDGSSSYQFSGLKPGSYVVRFYFWGEGDLPPRDECAATVGYDSVEPTATPEPTNTPTPEPTNTPTPEPTNTPTPEPTNTPEPEPTNMPQPDETEVPRPQETEPTSRSEDRGPALFSIRGPQPSDTYNDADVSTTNATGNDQQNGTIFGQVDFEGTTKLVVKLYAENDQATQLDQAGLKDKTETFEFKNLKPGAYVIKYFFYGDDTPCGVSVVKVGSDEDSAMPNVFVGASVGAEDASGKTEKNGSIAGSVNFTGKKIVAKLYDAAGNKLDEQSIADSTVTFKFENLAPGVYTITYTFWGDKDKVSGTSTATVGYDGQESENNAFVQAYTTQTNATTNAAKDGWVTGRADFVGSTLVAKLFKTSDLNTVIDQASLRNSTESFTFKGLEPGEYVINYYFFNEKTECGYNVVTIGYDVRLATQIEAKAEGGDNRVDVTVTKGDDVAISVKLMQGSTVNTTQTIAAGSRSTSFTGIAAGSYSVVIDYETPRQGSNAVIIDNVPVKEARAPISITSVQEGEKILIVRGTAQAGAAIQVKTVPATPNAAMVVESNGTFEWVLAADPGTYTQVKVFYANDESSGDTETGSWTVTAPTVAPTITVDPIDNHSTTVVVQTGANLDVILTVPDGTLTAKSNSSGLAHFSLTHKYLEGEAFVVTVVYGSGSGQTVSKTVKVGDAVEYKDLEQGDYGEAVLRLTTRLNQLGYPVAPTKDYNSAVREAVRLFQIANGQEADGEAGDRMQAALYSVSAIRYGSGRYPTLVRGDKGLALIKTLQQRLKDLGYYTIKVDGIFGSGTQRAVRLFQQVNGLPDTGIADNATQVLLYSSAAKPLGYGPAGSYSTLQRSSKYKSAVVPLQRRLRELGYYTGSIDGYFGSKTYRAVRNFQSRNSLKVTGIADPLTQQVLYSSAAKKYNGSTAGSSSGSSVGYRLLYWGCRGEEVRRLQNALISAGYKKYVRSADGIYGQWTYDAVCAYQRDHGLTVDGIAGKNTQNSLYGTNY